MPRGKRKPIEQHILDGTYRQDRHGPRTPDVEPEPPPSMPEKLTDEEAVAWGTLTDILRGVVKQRDVPTLVELCRWVVRADRVAKALDAMKPGAKGFSSMMTSAAIATDKILVLSSRFGVSPLDRAKLRAEEPKSLDPPKPKVAVRGKTKLDTQGAPPG